MNCFCSTFFFLAYIVLFRSSISVRELKHLNGGVYEQVVSNLQSPASCPSTFLSLMIVCKLYPDPGSNEDVFGGSLFRLLSSPLLKMRSVAARALVLVCPDSALDRFVSLCAKEWDLCSNNRLNGMLIFLLECCKARPDSFISNFHPIECIEKALHSTTVLSINASLIIQILSILRKSGWTPFKLEISGKSCPSNLLDYVGIWHFEGNNNAAVFEHIQNHYGSLTDLFWKSLDHQFYFSLSSPNVVWLLNQLTLSSARYVEKNLVLCIFNALNARELPDLDIPFDILNYLTENAGKYRHICALLSVTYNFSTCDNTKLEVAERELSFDSCNAKYLSMLYRIRCCKYNESLTAHVLATAVLHVQSEDEDLRGEAINFCMSHCVKLTQQPCQITPQPCQSTPQFSHKTPRYAMEFVCRFMRSLGDQSTKNEYTTALKKIRGKVLNREKKGFDIESNAHFDRELFLRITH